jgi:hypothetical protein
MIYRPHRMVIPVKNAPKVPGTFIVALRYFHILDEADKPIGPNISIREQIGAFLENPLAEEDFPTPTTPFENAIQKHRAFIASAKELVFESDGTGADLQVEFVPISLGTYRCLILFTDQRGSEFVYEIVAKAVLPEPEDRHLTPKVECGKEAELPSTSI